MAIIPFDLIVGIRDLQDQSSIAVVEEGLEMHIVLVDVVSSREFGR